MENKNPFTVLGIDPSLIKKLDDETLAEVIKSQYRILQKKYHPDKNNGKDVKSKELNLAYELISDSKNEHYTYFKGSFLRKTKNKKDDEIARLQEENKNYSDSLIKYFDGLAESNIFHPGACKMRIFDNAYALNFGIYDLTRGSAKEDYSYDLVIDENGELTREDKQGSKKLENKVLIGTISDKVSVENHGIKNILRLGKEIYTREDARIHFLKTRDRLNRRGSFVPSEKYENRINSAGFKNILPFISPVLEKWAYLFSVNKDDNGVFYSLDGFIRDITKY